MHEVTYSIDSRGSMTIGFDGKTARISGELVFDPPVFYADISAFNNWDPPFGNEEITASEKTIIIDFITKDSLAKIKTKIVFD